MSDRFLCDINFTVWIVVNPFESSPEVRPDTLTDFFRRCRLELEPGTPDDGCNWSPRLPPFVLPQLCDLDLLYGVHRT